ncbi:hypothetical protein M8C11_00910 [Micromonospora sp. CPM1]|uniref:hypothetical protein n=1 Tax=Micromonospora sp. CPM1 TaxID=2944809 RepID=UPI00207D4398|nr:hypothetical protein [Micromonospora sp. CPM1]MCO1613255.1 hypothetical protein [Micromonospora sp. CPM1]
MRDHEQQADAGCDRRRDPMMRMVLQRVTAGLLLLIGLLAMVATRTFPFLDDLSEPAETAVAIGGAACLLAGVWLWLRKPADRSPAAGDGEPVTARESEGRRAE